VEPPKYPHIFPQLRQFPESLTRASLGIAVVRV
jgi:hypothetical protein